MRMEEKEYSIKEALLFSQRISQLGKALWKSIEKDWQQWIKPYDLNINEHHILMDCLSIKWCFHLRRSQIWCHACFNGF